MQLRRSVPDLKRPFRLWAAPVIAPIAFILSSLVAFWGGFQALSYIFGALFAILIVYGVLRLIRGKNSGMSGFYNITWIFPYFIGLWLLSYFGPKVLGGSGDIGFFWSMLWVALRHFEWVRRYDCLVERSASRGDLWTKGISCSRWHWA
ncbi:hypothetical protein Acaty_m0026 (plasmid) [Acidithiobacillus caldus ATCC 51756]|uniref:Uncharacterized protein n=1 Tax=Acidithiobacillus caldus (strain ATCC 51756 / DSM 8584 / KU) TaxID=637389 RepID=A0A059ZUX0_ACICK|nr:hypothetical protein Acaty_m0026 [Acidithiobacillus caldus ATCC 51756]